MKRYLTSYTKGRLTVRDRITNQVASESFVDADTAEIIQNKIKAYNYTVPKKKPTVKTMSISDCPELLNSFNSEFEPEFGWIKPEKINWQRDEVKETIKNIETSIDKLNKLLELE